MLHRSQTEGKSILYLVLVSLYIVIIALLLCFACAPVHLYLKSPPTPVDHAEKYFKETSRIMIDYVPEEVLARCGVSISKNNKPPLTILVDNFDDASQANARYYPGRDPYVAYTEGNEQALIHEYQHFVNENLSQACIDEISAYYAEAIYDREQRIQRLIRIISDKDAKLWQYRRLTSFGK